MATITKVGTPTLTSLLPPPNMQLTGLTAGEAIGAFDAVYIKAADGKMWKANGTAANAAARARGWAAAAYASGEKGCTMYFGDITVQYGTGLTVSADLYLSATAGALDDAATTGGTTVIAYTIDATRVRLQVPR